VPVLLCLAALVTACTAHNAGDAAPATGVESRGPAGPVPDGLARFYGQPLTWTGCADYAVSQQDRSNFADRQFTCARLTVPVDYAQPAGATAQIALLRRRAADPAHRIGSLVINPGGPGGSGTSAAASLAGGVASSPLGARFDLVGFDPRGTGASRPAVQCLTASERDAQRLDDDTDPSPAGVARAEAEEQDFAARCSVRVGDPVLATLGTRDVVKDMDVLRSALGEAKLTYLGYSYGTRLGTAYAEAFPGSVRALVLDGAVDPQQSPGDALVDQAAGFEQAWRAYAASCAGQRTCPVGTDPAAADARVAAALTPLIGRPLAVGDRTLSYQDAVTGVIQALYTEQLWPVLTQALADLATGSGRKLLLLADSYYERDEDASGNPAYTPLTDANMAITCVDEPRVTDRAVVADVQRRFAAAAPFLDTGRGPVAALDTCAFWPVPPTEQPHKPVAAPGLPPVLVVSTTGDPATPYQSGVRLAADLNGSLLTVKGTQHTAFLQGDSCVDQLGVAYLIDLTRPAQGATCG
jgi:pimeloyl-ACP methyl ester carboxylesterase